MFSLCLLFMFFFVSRICTVTIPQCDPALPPRNASTVYWEGCREGRCGGPVSVCVRSDVYVCLSVCVSVGRLQPIGLDRRQPMPRGACRCVSCPGPAVADTYSFFSVGCSSAIPERGGRTGQGDLRETSKEGAALAAPLAPPFMTSPP